MGLLRVLALSVGFTALAAACDDLPEADDEDASPYSGQIVSVSVSNKTECELEVYALDDPDESLVLQPLQMDHLWLETGCHHVDFVAPDCGVISYVVEVCFDLPISLFAVGAYEDFEVLCPICE